MRLALLVGLFVSLAVVTAAAAASAPRRRTSLSWTRSRQNMPLTVAAFADADFQLLFGMDGDTFLALFDMVRSGFSMRNWLCSRQSPPNVGWQWLFVCSPGRPTWTVCWRLGWAGAPYLKYFNACARVVGPSTRARNIALQSSMSACAHQGMPTHVD